MVLMMIVALLLASGACCCGCPCVVDAPDAFCGGAGLASFPECVLASDNVTTLHFEGNRLTHLTDAAALRRLPGLTTLLLDRNALDTLWGAAFRDVPRLRRLSLRGNGLRFLPRDLFLWAAGVVALDLSHNVVAGFHEDVFRPLERLERLDLSGNLLVSVPTLWSPSLRTLDASANRLSCRLVAAALRAASASLLELDLSRNELRAVDLRRPLLPALRDLRLASNPWQCDCGLAPLQRFVAAGNFSADADATCALPPELHGDAMLPTVALMPCDDDEGDEGDEGDGDDADQHVTVEAAGHAKKALAVTGVAVAVVVVGVVGGALGVAGLRRLRQRNAEFRLAQGEEAPLEMTRSH